MASEIEEQVYIDAVYHLGGAELASEIEEQVYIDAIYHLGGAELASEKHLVNCF